jgi:hypothetical protein
MGAEVMRQFRQDPASVGYDGLVAAWLEVDSQAAWYRVLLALEVDARHGDLQRYAKDVGVQPGTMYDYRSVGRAYDVQISGRPEISFAVAKALMGQPDRLELAKRETPWTQDQARALVAERARKELPAGKPGSGQPRSSAPDKSAESPGAAHQDPEHQDPEHQDPPPGPAAKPAHVHRWVQVEVCASCYQPREESS